MDGHLGYRAAGTRAVLPVALMLMLASVGQSFAVLTQDEQGLLSQISVARMMTTIERLCADDFRGRRAGSSEHYAAADFLASVFSSCGLEAHPGIDGYKQPLTMRYALVRSKEEIKATLSYKVSGKHGAATQTRSFSYRGYNGRGGLDLSSKVVFVGYGICDPEAGHDDYAGLDVDGKIVLWLQGQPKGLKLLKAATISHKMVTAYQRGAVACLVWNRDSDKDEWGTNTGLAGAIADFPVISVDGCIVGELLAPCGIDPTVMLSPGTKALTIGLEGAETRLQVRPVCDPDRRTYNIVGVMPGTDPVAAHEVILVGAHYDHLGDTAKGEVFQGADDNASGTSVMLEIARAIGEACLRPRRTIVFAAWTGEEAGLVGSNYFASNPPLPLESIAASIQLDMVGAGTPGKFKTGRASARSEQYCHLVTSAEDLGFSLDATSALGASDHLAFLRKRVPSFIVHSAGEHPHYHTVRDTPEAIDREVLESAAKLVTLAVWRAANG